VTAPEPLDPLARWRDRVDFDGLVPPVVVGCSGGADSTALLALAGDAGLAPVAVHVDHGIRPDSSSDAVGVAALARRLGVPCRVVRISVEPGANLEARARDARYAALEGARADVDASAVLVAHTADDQAETVLLNVLRGAAASGLAGMAHRRDRIARPLLAVRRADTVALCASLGLEPLHDPMNDDRAFRRVALRHDVLPLLERVAGRDVVPVLARQAEILRAESEYLDELARAAWPVGGRSGARELASMPLALARRAVRLWLGSPPASSAEVERVLDVARGERRAVQLAGGRTVRRAMGHLRVECE
jgi:tRNA(Ile)-lysidine synthase